ncbi:MAG: hypothetical protein ABSE48_20680 [Verrucomicrobiota bacterium]|jgi:hypothetical protein
MNVHAEFDKSANIENQTMQQEVGKNICAAGKPDQAGPKLLLGKIPYRQRRNFLIGLRIKDLLLFRAELFLLAYTGRIPAAFYAALDELCIFLEPPPQFRTERTRSEAVTDAMRANRRLFADLLMHLEKYRKRLSRTKVYLLGNNEELAFNQYGLIVSTPIRVATGGEISRFLLKRSPEIKASVSFVNKLIKEIYEDRRAWFDAYFRTQVRATAWKFLGKMILNLEFAMRAKAKWTAFNEKTQHGTFSLARIEVLLIREFVHPLDDRSEQEIVLSCSITPLVMSLNDGLSVAVWVSTNKEGGIVIELEQRVLDSEIAGRSRQNLDWHIFCKPND